MRLLPLVLAVDLALILACAAPGAEETDGEATDAVDRDGDGYTSDEDCNDAVADIHPGATEVCDPADVDEDCNGLSDNADAGAAGATTVYHDADGDGYGAEAVSACETSPGYVGVDGDCDDGDAAANPDSVWFDDVDGDGFGDPAVMEAGCEQPAGFVAEGTDCDDRDPDLHPETPWFYDADQDGHGDAADTRQGCVQPAGYVADDQDCDDDDADVSPDGQEVCDAANVDEDCDGAADDDDATVSEPRKSTWYLDTDGDTYGDPGETVRACDRPVGATDDDTDCDDGDAGVSPAATEVCDAADTDEDCDGLSDDEDPSATGTSSFYVDSDGDGYGGTTPASACDARGGYSTLSTDCDDARAFTYPGAADAWYDGVDADCAGDDDYDQDGDGVAWPDDCFDTDPSTVPSAEVLDGVDNDCDDLLDELSVASAAAGALYGSGSSTALGGVGRLSLGGDLTGDGADDLVVVSASGSGTAWVVPGATASAAAGFVESYDTAQISGESSSYPLASVIGPMRDSTRDGKDDLLIGGGSTSGSTGQVYLLTGGSTLTGSVAVTSARAEFTGQYASDTCLLGVAGDIDGDGNDDVVMGCPYDNYYDDEGSVSVFDGDALSGSYTDGTADDFIYGASTDDHYGWAVAAGDLDGDGYDDILASARNYGTSTMSGTGAVYIVPGNRSLSWSSSVTYAATATIIGDYYSDYLGLDALANPGDVDGDGTLDLVLTNNYRGEVLVYYDAGSLSGTVTTASPDLLMSGTARELGSSIAYNSDLDGDGADELAVGDEDSDTAAVGAGVVYVFSLASAPTGSLATEDALATFYGAASGDAAGSGLAGGGDADGDGRDDLLVGATGVDAGTAGGGAAYVILGW